MSNSIRSFLAESVKKAAARARRGWRILLEKGPSQFQFWLISLMIGIAAGFAALLFRKGIEALQSTLYGVDDTNMLHSYADALAWYWLLVIPIGGGLVVGIILDRFTADARVRAVADVIEGAALKEGRVEKKEGCRVCAGLG